MFKIVLCLSGLLLVTANLEDHKESEEDASKCNDLGLHRLMIESVKLMDTKKLQNILSNAAANDPEVCELRKLIRSAEFQKKLDKLKASKERCLLFDYICRSLHVDYGKYIHFSRNFMNINTAKKPTCDIENPRPGIRGLFEDLTDALPKHSISKLYQRLVREDCELGTSVQRIRSAKYQQLISNFRLSKEYNDVYKSLVCAGVPMEAVKRLINTAFGWTNVEAGVEKTIWFV